MSDAHDFQPHVSGRFPNACVRCGRTREWHEKQQQDTSTPEGDTDAAQARSGTAPK